MNTARSVEAPSVAPLTVSSAPGQSLDVVQRRVLTVLLGHGPGKLELLRQHITDVTPREIVNALVSLEHRGLITGATVFGMFAATDEGRDVAERVS